MAGLEILVEAMGRSERQAVKSQLIRLISHVLKWKCQSEQRTVSWAATIFSARQEIETSQEEIPSLNRSFLESIWDAGFTKAVKAAELEMGQRCQLTALTWEAVFEEDYQLLQD